MKAEIGKGVSPFLQRIYVRVVATVLLLLFCSVASGGPITVAAAANVYYVVDELRTAFKKSSGIDIRTVVASSGKLTAQIENGAPYDIFLSADMKYPQRLKREGFALNEPRVYATGYLVVWTLEDIDIKDSLFSLKGGSIERIAIPNPKSAPYGVEALKALKAAGIYEELKSRLVYAESVSQTNRYIFSKAVDAGITAKSVVLSPKMAGRGHYVDVDPSLYDPIEQGAVILKHAKSMGEREARAFYDYLFGPEARAILKKYGYGVK